MQEQTKLLAFAHATEELPKEACGLILISKGKEIYFKCKHIVDNPEDAFVIDPDDYITASNLGEITAIFHSHPVTPALPSEADKVACEKSGLMWIICNPQLNAWCEYRPCGYRAPLVGREWVWGITDCWSLTRDWYAENGIELCDWERPIDPIEFTQKPLFEKLYESTGFFPVENRSEMQRGDAVLISLVSNTLNHCGVYLGDGLLLHHVGTRLSSVDMYGEWLHKSTDKVLRHYDWRKLSSAENANNQSLRQIS